MIISLWARYIKLNLEGAVLILLIFWPLNGDSHYHPKQMIRQWEVLLVVRWVPNMPVQSILVLNIGLHGLWYQQTVIRGTKNYHIYPPNKIINISSLPQILFRCFTSKDSSIKESGKCFFFSGRSSPLNKITNILSSKWTNKCHILTVVNVTSGPKEKEKRERGRTYIVRCDPSVAESTRGNSRRKVHAIGTKITFHFCC